MDMLQRRRPYIPLSPHWCSLCYKNRELIHHIFLHWSFSHKIWCYFLVRIGLYWVMPKEIRHLFSSWTWYGSNVRSKLFGECLLYGEYGGKGITEFSSTERGMLKRLLKQSLGRWEVGFLSPWNIKISLSLFDFVCDWVTTISCSKHPKSIHPHQICASLSHGYLKLNFDGAYKGNTGPAGMVVGLGISNGIVCKVLCGPLGHCNSTKAEAQSMLIGLKEFKKMKVFGCIIEGDSEVVIGWGQGKECLSWRMWRTVYEIMDIAAEWIVLFLTFLGSKILRLTILLIGVRNTNIIIMEFVCLSK